MPIHILILGSGGREHALAWKAAQEGHRVSVAPGSDGMRELATVLPVSLADHEAVVQLARSISADLVVIGPEEPLVAGLADALRANAIATFGPSKAAAELEGSKSAAKEFMFRHAIPTAKYEVASTGDDALAKLKLFPQPPVVKASGLAAGKGVTVAETFEEASAAIQDCLSGRRFGDAGGVVVLEERLQGEEVSFFSICDGEHAIHLAACQDHKRVGEGDTGPNTGGMGAYLPAPVCTDEVRSKIISEVVEPTLAGLREEGRPFVGVLFCGLMIDVDGNPRLIEYNVRFGDPETQPLMVGLREPIMEDLLAAAHGNLKMRDPVSQPAASVVLASAGYPATSTKGSPISGLEAAGGVNDVIVFHAGTRLEAPGAWVSNGGRVLGICATAKELNTAVANAYQALDCISMPGGHARRDIAHRALNRDR